MVRCGCLETKALKFCKDSEYQADMSTSKTSKDRKRIFNQSLRYLQKQIFDYIGSNFSSGTKNTLNKTNFRLDQRLHFANTLEQRLQKAKRHEKNFFILFSTADTIVLFFDTCSVQMA